MCMSPLSSHAHMGPKLCILSHNLWLVKKPAASNIPWDKCQEKDVQLVVGFDKINKYLRDPPGKVTKTEQIYSALANWKIIGELDFSDFYFQLPFKNETQADKLKLGYLCVRTSMGTLTFARAPMGLLGMDVWQH